MVNDTHGRQVLVSQGARGLRFGYDAKGRLQSIRDTLTRTTTFEYDNADRETLRTLPEGGKVHFSYDANGNVATIVPPGSAVHSHTFGYSGVDQTLQYTPPVVSGVSLPATSYAYNDDHQLTRVTRPDGALVSLAYNSTKGRLDSVTIARGRVGVSYSSTTGMVSSLSSPDTVTTDLGYDGSLLTSETWSGKLPGSVSLAVAHSYNSRLEDSSVTVGSTSAILYSHDLDGLVTAAGALSIDHRSDNGLVDSTKVSNVTGSLDYDDAGALANLSYTYNGSTTLFSQNILRDALGRITQITENDFGTSRTLYYRYDLAGRLYGVKLNSDTVATYAYDPNGNRIAVNRPSFATDSSTYDEQDRLLSFGHLAAGYTRYTYTAAGELLSMATGPDTTRYLYDPLGNLVTVTLPSGDLVRYSADGEGRRVGRRVNGHWSGGWVYGGPLSIAADLDSTGAVGNRYVYGEKHTPELILNGASTYRVITDQLGSVRGVVDASSGAVVEQIDYDAWGVPTVVSGAWFQPLGYAGGLADTLSGLVRFGARDYDPAAARWTAKDPVGFGGGDANLYSYASSDPVGSGDANGLIRDTREEGPRLPSDHQTNNCQGTSRDTDALFVFLSSWVIHDQVLRDAKAKKFHDPAAYDAWIHAEAAHRIAIRFGREAAFQMGVLQEYESAADNLRHLHGSGIGSTDTEHDFMNDWQGLSYGMNGDELLKRGMLLKSPSKRLPPE